MAVRRAALREPRVEWEPNSKALGLIQGSAAHRGAQTLLRHRQFKEHWTEVRGGRGEHGARIGGDWAHVRLKKSGQASN